jgi:phosphoribosyl-ATP pyrophosphohydrolase
MLIPSIDLQNGQAVQLKQGRTPVLSDPEVLERLRHFARFGEVALIDLDAAMGKGNNRELILQCLAEFPCRVGGGIRDLATAELYLKAGASAVILGTSAKEDFVTRLPRQRVIIALDAWGDDWVTEGWRHDSGEPVLSLIEDMSQRCGEFLYTQVQKEGLLQGLDRERIQRVVKASPVPVTVAGGISSLDDLSFLRSLGVNAQVGMALYTGVFSLEDAFLATCRFNDQGLLPTIVSDYQTKDVLMLAYSNPVSLRKALSQGEGIYWSRSRQQLWIKGATSGHRQRLVRVQSDCDGDSLLFEVIQQGHACHLQRPSCFPGHGLRFDLKLLDERLHRRQQENSGSYTGRLLAEGSLAEEKVLEEAQELVESREPDHVRWEAADVFYHALVLARKRGVPYEAILNELRWRYEHR